ncbi:hypothetical protein [Marininema halotolerans]|uniref:Uncharacterized protein n=1 Tax=Marininema halotolerans TaxID=1155944 RepID=A0A1I6RHW7_9BACL|nr:hypothetical protein [Marininema halotolerans]SFS64058.1 hypothetical protein SAMN05444972_10590 [Marininema halotolerans]
MKALRTSELLKIIQPYTFFDWDNEQDSQQKSVVNLAIPESKHPLAHQIYDPSWWGFDAIDNPHAPLFLNEQNWISLEVSFFSWLQPAIECWLKEDEIIATPYLNHDWWCYFDDKEPNGVMHRKWVQNDDKHYKKLLILTSTITNQPVLRDNYRAATLHSYDEFIALEKMAVKGIPLLFLTQGKMVISVTDYLTVKIEFCDHETKEIVMRMLDELIGIHLLE